VKPEHIQALSVIVPQYPSLVQQLRNPTWAWISAALVVGFELGSEEVLLAHPFYGVRHYST
jgi:hypothetical protein